MKKILSLIFACIFTFGVFTVSSCSNDGFEVVKSITFVSDGERASFRSSAYAEIKCNNAIEITEKEFLAMPKERRFILSTSVSSGAFNSQQEILSVSKITIEDAIKRADGATYYEEVEEDLQGYIYTQERGGYYKKEYQLTYFNFVYVKVKSDTTLVIRKGKETVETTYIVTSYSISRFE